MQPGQTPEKGFQWDEASKSYGIPSQVLRGEVPIQPNAQPFQPYQQNVQPAQQMMGNGMMGNGMMGNGMMGNGMMAPTKATTAFDWRFYLPISCADRSGFTHYGQQCFENHNFESKLPSRPRQGSCCSNHFSNFNNHSLHNHGLHRLDHCWVNDWWILRREHE